MGAKNLISDPGAKLEVFASKFRTFLDVMRIGPAINCVILVLVGIFLHPNAFDWLTATLAAIVMLFIYAIVYLYNYFTDVEEDKLNDSYNPVMDDTYRRVIIAYIVFALAATVVICLEYLGTLPLAVAGFFLLIGFLYSTPPFRFKKRFILKNVAIGLLWGPLLLVMTTSLTGTIALVDLVMVTFFGIISLMASIISDFRDLEGDREAGVRTVPVVLGIRGTAHYFLMWTIIQILVVVVPVALGYVSPIYLLVFLALPSRIRLVHSVYYDDLEEIQNGPEIPGMIIATVALGGAALIDLGVV